MTLAKSLYLDIYPEEPDVKNGFYKSHLIRAHSIAKIKLAGPLLYVAVLNADWLKDQLNRGNIDIPNQRLDGGILLTASTKYLQQFVRDHGEDPGIFGEPTELRLRN